MRGLFMFLVAVCAVLVFWIYSVFFYVPFDTQLRKHYVKQCVESMIYYKRAVSVQHATDQCETEAKLKYPNEGAAK